MKLLFTFFISMVITIGGMAQTVSSFENFDLPIDTFWNGNDLSGDFIDGGLIFSNIFDTTYNFWSGGWAISTMRDDSTAGFTNIYSAIPAKAARGNNYAVGQQNTEIYANLYDEVLYQGLWVTNTTYAYLSMKYGDSFAKKFGGESGEDPDFFKLRIHAIQNGNIDTTNFVDFYLADFRGTDSTKDYIVDSWKYVDLSSLGYVNGLSFELISSDTGQWGMNTPAFFAVDKVKISYRSDNSVFYEASFDALNVPLDSFWYNRDGDYFRSDAFRFKSTYDTTYKYWSGGFALSSMRNDSTSGFTNLFGSIAAGAYNGSTYAVGQNNADFVSGIVDAVPAIKSIQICNTTYAYLSMKNGDSFAKKFGGDDGNDPDYFKIRIYGIYSVDGSKDTSRYIDFYLADFRFSDNSEDYIINDWTEINIEESLGEPLGLSFELSSSDNGDYGMNTPAFFVMDKVLFDLRTGVSNLGDDLKFTIYPNPANDYIKIATDTGKCKYNIYNMQGKIISKGILNNNTMLDVENLEAGIYLISVEEGKKRSVKRFVKVNKE